MNFVVITHTEHCYNDGAWFAYGPFVREMNIWKKNVDYLILVAPKTKNELSNVHVPYSSKNIEFSKIPSISILSFSEIIKTILFIPGICFKIFRAMNKADHIHLRCPGNIGLIGCVVQIFFPKKPKTAKYAGNWDPKAKQPRSYRFQKWLLSNTFLTKNMQVLVYGNWPDQSKNIRSFFTASYSKSQMTPILEKDFNKILYKFIFVGSLSPGKRPLYSVQLIEQLNKLGLLCVLDIYGEGEERNKLELFIEDHDLIDLVRLHGNQTSETVKEEYKNSDFLILPSRSEGWPKAVAEAMFWGVIPIATRISCVPWMLEHGERGILIDTNLKEDIDKLLELFKKKEQLKKMSLDAQQWSQQYTLDKFEIEIKNLL